MTLRQDPKSGSQHIVPGQITANGGFRGLARWLTGPYASDAQRNGFFSARPAGGVIDTEDPGGASDELGMLLAAIADDVHRHVAAAREGVLADFSARAAHARKHLSRNLLAATLAAIKEQRKAAMALIRRNASLEIAARRKAAIAAFGNDRIGKSRRRLRIKADTPTP